MSERRAGFEALAAAADGLARACATACRLRVIEHHGGPPLSAELRMSLRTTMTTPADMTGMLGKMK